MANRTLVACLAEIKANPTRFYVYVMSRPDGTPFYVGVGKIHRRCSQRIAIHEREAKSKARSRKLAMIRQIKIAGQQIIYAIESWHDEWAAALAREVELIAIFGRADKGCGPLTNMTDGGDGVLGLPADARKKQADAQNRRWADPANRKKSSEQKRAMWRERRAEFIAKMKAAANTPERRAQYARDIPRLIAKSRLRTKSATINSPGQYVLKL